MATQMADIRIEIPRFAQPADNEALVALLRRVRSVFARFHLGRFHFGQIERVAGLAKNSGTSVETRFLAAKEAHLSDLARYPRF